MPAAFEGHELLRRWTCNQRRAAVLIAFTCPQEKCESAAGKARDRDQEYPRSRADFGSENGENAVALGSQAKDLEHGSGAVCQRR
jgi:hypothetical protein